MRLKLLIISSLFIIFGSGCYTPVRVKTADNTVDLLSKVTEFYTFLLDREVGNRHNDQDEKFRKFFLDQEGYYDFLDSYMLLAKDRNFIYHTFHTYYILDAKMAEDGNSAEVHLMLLSKDAPLIYRKIEMTHSWSKTYEAWYPGKVKAPMLTKWTKITNLYSLPPKRR